MDNRFAKVAMVGVAAVTGVSWLVAAIAIAVWGHNVSSLTLALVALGSGAASIAALADMVTRSMKLAGRWR